MKKINTLLFLLLTLTSVSLFAQTALPMDTVSGKVTYEGIIDMPTATQTQLYEQGIAWGKQHYKNAENAFFQSKDAEKGKIVGKHRFNLWQDVDGKRIRSQKMIKYTLTLWFKDGKYRYRITDINLQQASYFPIENWLKNGTAKEKELEDYIAQMDNFFNELTAALKQDMAKLFEESTRDEDDW